MRKKLVNYVKSRNRTLFEQNLSGFHIFLKDKLPDNIDLEEVFSRIKTSIPDEFLNLVDVVYIGSFDMFDRRNINATYVDGALYITNKQSSNIDMIDDIVHEIAHAVDEKYKYFLHDDETIKNEYFGKLKKLKNYLAFEGYDIRNINFFNEKYDKQFDNFLYKNVGYERLKPFIKDLFLDPYSCTSLQEYFSTCFV